MQFATIVAAFFAATAAAIPSSSRGGDAAAQALQQLQAQGGCDILGCIVALGPDALSCALAIAMEGVDVQKDIACIKSVIGDVSNPPEACAACF